MKLETLLVFGIIFAALLVSADLAGELSDCTDKGGIMVKTRDGWYECIGGRR